MTINTFLSKQINKIVILLSIFTVSCHGHGRLIEPPSRASAWRYGFQTPPNYNDHELFCGGFDRQWQKNKGKCGECGDAWDLPIPRPNELGGNWGQGIIVRKYAPTTDVTLRVELTASHMGYFEFRLCPQAGGRQECLDKHILTILGGTPSVPAPSDLATRFYPRNGSRIYEMRARLPADFKCDHCMLQWRYVAGNNWGTCPDGTGAVGCGPQEEFRACADISIGGTGRTTKRPFRTTTRPSTTDTVQSTETPLPGSGEEPSQDERYIAVLIAALALLVVLCLLATCYLYYYHGSRVKHLLQWRSARASNATSAMLSKEENLPESKIAPVPPPRTKRLSLIKDISPDESCIIVGQTSPKTSV